jgi:hypothetical protein
MSNPLKMPPISPSAYFWPEEGGNTNLRESTRINTNSFFYSRCELIPVPSSYYLASSCRGDKIFRAATAEGTESPQITNKENLRRDTQTCFQKSSHAAKILFVSNTEKTKRFFSVLSVPSAISARFGLLLLAALRRFVFSPIELLLPRFVLLLLLSLVLPGCANDPNPKLATAIDPKLGNSEYWFNRPAVEKIVAADYDTLWNACEATLVDGSFSMERFDYRTGLLTSKPLVSKQFFELWKNDIVTFNDQILSDAATRRRVVHFQIKKQPDGCYVCEVKVVVEHYSMPERRITSVSQYRDSFSPKRQYEESQMDDGTPVRSEYWYAERRDEPLEHWLAARVREHLRMAVAGANK